jgi:DUF4097 and DUF4098 domain-containing protein YvlB
MRSFIILAMFTASLANAAWSDYEEIQELELDGRGIDTLAIDAGAGSMEVIGVSGSDKVMVTATIQVPNKNDDDAREIIQKDLTLTLEKNGEKAELKSFFDNSGWMSDESGSVRIEVRVPERMSLDIKDSSGSITIDDVKGNIDIDDSSGSIKMSDVGGNVLIDDSSGSISVDGVGKDISIEDGSGSITVKRVGGSVTVDDGSGSIRVTDVEKDLIIESDGSGSVKFSDIRGTVQNDS